MRSPTYMERYPTEEDVAFWGLGDLDRGGGLRTSARRLASPWASRVSASAWAPAISAARIASADFSRPIAA